MAEVKVTGLIPASAKEVWALVGDFSALDRFVEAVDRCTVEGEGPGAVRTLTLQDGGQVQEKLDTLDNEQHILTYSIIESPMPIQNYTGIMQVREAENGKSEFIWASSFDAEDEMEDEMLETLEGLYSLGVEGLKNRF